MIARVVRILFVAWFVLLAGLVALARSTDWTPGCCIGLYLLLFGHPTLLAIEMLLARHIAARSDAPRARWRDLPRAVSAMWPTPRSCLASLPGNTAVGGG